MFILGSLESA